MSTKLKTKLCWNCEGSVSRQLDNCPYCGVYMHPNEEDEDFDEDEELDLSPPYPYLPERENGSTHHSPPYVVKEQALDENKSPSSLPEAVSTFEIKQIFIPLTLLLTGSIFLLFGVILYLFSDHGLLSLHWKSFYWPFYVFSGLAALYSGWLALKKLNDDR